MNDLIAAPPPGRIVGIARDYPDIIAIARAQMARLNITFETLDSVSGVPSGYSAKLLGPNPCKRIGITSLSLLMGALGIQFVAVENTEQLARIAHRLTPRRHRHRSAA